MNRTNVYICDICNYYVVTIDRAEGVMRSQMYRTSSILKTVGVLIPRFEWYAPSDEEFARLNKGLQAHVAKGGLVLREIQR